MLCIDIPRRIYYYPTRYNINVDNGHEWIDCSSISTQFQTNESSENTFAPLSKCKWHVLPIFIKNLEERSLTEALIVSSVCLSLSNSWVNMLCYTKNKKSLDWHWLGWGNELCRTTVTRLFLSGTGTHVNILSGRQNEPTHQKRESRHPAIASQLTNPHTCLFTIDILSNKTPIFQVDILDGDRICDLIASALLYQFYSSSDRSDMWYIHQQQVARISTATSA